MADTQDNSREGSAGAESPNLDDAQREQAAEHSTPHALVIHEIVREEGEAAMERTFAALMWSALAAVSKQFSETLSGSVQYSFNQRSSDIQGRSFVENLVVVALQKQF